MGSVAHTPSRFLLAGALLLGCATASAVDATPPLHSFEAPLMGTRFRVLIHSSDAASARKASDAAFDEARRLNQIFSDYDPDSELMRLTRQSPGESIAISAELHELLALSSQLAGISDGDFDATLGPLHRLWKQSRRTSRLPDPVKLRSARESSGHHLLSLGPGQTATLHRTGMRLDLGGIAKGYTADRMLQVIAEQFGLRSALIAAGGDIVVGAPPPNQTGWLVALTSVHSPSKPDAFVRLAHAAVSTSGDSAQFLQIEGQRFSHILDPATGLGLTERRSVSVIARRGVFSDALATCLSVDPGHLSELAPPWQPLAVRFVTDDGEERLHGDWTTFRESQPPESTLPSRP